MSDQEQTSGVQELIDRLSQEGVAEGHRQAERIVTEAEMKAERILESARRDAEEILQRATDEVEQMQSAGKEALQLATRDTIRDFSARLHNDFRDRLQNLVHHQLRDPQLVRDLILEITRRATEDVGQGPIEILLPLDIVSEQEVRERIQADDADALTQFVQGLIGEDLREGFTVSLGSRSHDGLTVRVVDDQLEIDLTDEAIAELLFQHLMPRFRAIMRDA